MAEYKNKTREELVKALEERDKVDKAREEAESKAEENVLLEKQRLEILIAQKKALGEVYEAKQLELKLLEKLEDLDDAAYIRSEEMLELVRELSEAKSQSEEKSVEQKIKALASELVYQYKPKEYSRQQNQWRNPDTKKYTTCRLKKRLTSKYTNKKACIYEGGNKTFTMMIETWCPKKYRCVYDPNGSEPDIDKVMDSLRSIGK